MAATSAASAEPVAFAQSEPLESGGGVTYPEPVPPPKRDLYPERNGPSQEAKLPPTRPEVVATSTRVTAPAIPERQATHFTITVTDPVKETMDGVLPGMKSTFHTYCISTSTTMTSYNRPENSVRRRFRDFVDLSNLLNENYRGYFVPPRPHRSWYQGKFLMKPKFIEERRVLLERYLRALASHPTIRDSSELRVFLETSEKLSGSPDWSRLHGQSPSILEGTSKFFKQMIGRERVTPSAAEVTRPPSMRKDFVWSFRESMKNLEDRRRPQLYEGPEFELREERIRMEEFKKDVDAAWKWASYWMDRTDAVGRNNDSIAEAFTALAEYEAEARYLRIEAPGIIGKGATQANGVYRQCLQEASNPLSTIYNYTEMMRPVLAAMKTREKALNTVQMLQRDLESKQAKVRQLEIQPSKQAKAEQLREDITGVEASLVAAQSYYERVTQNNTEEATRFRNYRAEDWMEMLKSLANVEYNSCIQLRDIWREIARELGADATALKSLQ